MKTIRRSVWPALSGAVCIALIACSVIALIACSALGGTYNAAAAHAATPHKSGTARSATPPFLRQMARVLGRVRSYQLTVRATSAGDGIPVTATSTEIVLRRGTTIRVHLTALVQRAGQVSRTEEVFTGTHLCLRTNARGAWSCRPMSGSALSGLGPTDAAHLAPAFGLSGGAVAVGQQTRQGQICRGYRFSLSAGGLRGQGTLWLARATALPVEEDVVSTLALVKGASPLVVRTTQRWNRWNDPHLTIPAVPAS